MRFHYTWLKFLLSDDRKKQEQRDVSLISERLNHNEGINIDEGDAYFIKEAEGWTVEEMTDPDSDIWEEEENV